MTDGGDRARLHNRRRDVGAPQTSLGNITTLHSVRYNPLSFNFTSYTPSFASLTSQVRTCCAHLPLPSTRCPSEGTEHVRAKACLTSNTPVSIEPIWLLDAAVSYQLELWLHINTINAKQMARQRMHLDEETGPDELDGRQGSSSSSSAAEWPRRLDSRLQ